MRGELSVNSPDVWEENYQITHQMYERRIIKLTRCMRRELSFDSPDIWEENYQIRNYSFFPGCNWALEIPGFIIINNPGVYIFLKITQIFSSNYAWVLELYILNYLYDFVRIKRFKIGKVKISKFCTIRFQEDTRIRRIWTRFQFVRSYSFNYQKLLQGGSWRAKLSR